MFLHQSPVWAEAHGYSQNFHVQELHWLWTHLSLIASPYYPSYVNSKGAKKSKLGEERQHELHSYPSDSPSQHHSVASPHLAKHSSLSHTLFKIRTLNLSLAFSRALSPAQSHLMEQKVGPCCVPCPAASGLQCLATCRSGKETKLNPFRLQ